MRGEITLKILEFIEDGIIDASDLLMAFLNAGYGASIKAMDYELRKIRKGRTMKDLTKMEARELRGKYYTLLYKLKKNGLIEEKEDFKKKIFSLTKSGLNKLEELQIRKRKELPSPHYKKESGEHIIIVIFDIPEKERSKRNWLRQALESLGLKLIQKSVWIGKQTIPQKFIEDLRLFKLIDYVEIFEITKTGSLKQRI